MADFKESFLFNLRNSPAVAFTNIGNLFLREYLARRSQRRQNGKAEVDRGAAFSGLMRMSTGHNVIT
jgi:hypothetical protein